MLEIKEKSAYLPIKVKVHGKIYESKPMFRSLIRKMSVFEKRIQGGELECTYDQIELLFGKKPIWDKLELREINEIIRYCALHSFRAEKALKDEPGDKAEKKPNGSGDKS